MSLSSYSLSGAALAAVSIVILVRAAAAESGLSADQREQELAVLMQCALTVQSRHVTDSLITVAIEEGAAESMALLIDSMDFARADWRPLDRSFTVDLGPGDGRREIWLGVRSKSGLDYRRMTWVIHWPSNGMKLAGDAFTLRGQLDDPTASVEVTGLSAATIRGVVERNGLFWVEELPARLHTSEGRTPG
jgi:hypothetical protein